MPAVVALWKREIVKFLRDRNRVGGAVLQPLGFWLLIGLGLQSSFQMPTDAGLGYMEFLFPGILTMVLLFTALFSTISMVEERTSGFLQAALVAPASRLSLALGLVLGGTTLATGQAALFLALVPALDLSPTLPGLALALIVCFLTGMAFTALGVRIAWKMETTRGFHAVMNIVLLPLWLLSGAVFPLTGAPVVFRWIMLANPVTYALAALRHALYLPGPAPDVLVSLPLALAVTVGFAALMLWLATAAVRKPLFG